MRGQDVSHINSQGLSSAESGAHAEAAARFRSRSTPKYSPCRPRRHAGTPRLERGAQGGHVHSTLSAGQVGDAMGACAWRKRTRFEQVLSLSHVGVQLSGRCLHCGARKNIRFPWLPSQMFRYGQVLLDADEKKVVFAHADDASRTKLPRYSLKLSSRLWCWRLHSDALLYCCCCCSCK